MMASSDWNFGCQPSSRFIFSEEAISRGGSPGRRGFSTMSILRPVTFLRGLDHFAHARAAAGAEIVEFTFRRVEREDVRPGKIDNVNVIADAGAIRRVVIGPVNFDVRLLAERNFEHVRNEMGFDAMVFAEFF